jgi:hypothetical protein
MADRMPTDGQLASALTALGRDVAFPQAPTLTSAVTARLSAERARGARPRVPGLALIGRRRALVLVAAGLLALLALAGATRLAIGAFEVRVQPKATPSPSLPPVEPSRIGDPVSEREAVAQAGFEPALPPGPAPDEVYVIDTDFGDAGILYAWRPSAAYPRIEGTDWGLMLIVAQGDQEFVSKSVDRFDALVEVKVNGDRAFWIPAPHEVSITTDQGSETFSVTGNVLIWQEGDLSYRLETSLGRAEAIALAESAS